MKTFYITQGHNVALERDQKIDLDLKKPLSSQKISGALKNHKKSD